MLCVSYNGKDNRSRIHWRIWIMGNIIVLSVPCWFISARLVRKLHGSVYVICSDWNTAPCTDIYWDSWSYINKLFFIIQSIHLTVWNYHYDIFFPWQPQRYCQPLIISLVPVLGVTFAHILLVCINCTRTNICTSASQVTLKDVGKID